MGNCQKSAGAFKLVVGALLLLNAFVWPLWTDLNGWIAWVAVLMVAGGFLKLVMPECKGRNGACEMPKAAPAKKTTRKRKR